MRGTQQNCHSFFVNITPCQADKFATANASKVKEYYDFENNKIKFEGNIEKKNNQYSWIGNQVYYNKLGKKDTVIDFDENGHGRIQHFFDNENISFCESINYIGGLSILFNQLIEKYNFNPTPLVKTSVSISRS